VIFFGGGVDRLHFGGFGVSGRAGAKIAKLAKLGLVGPQITERAERFHLKGEIGRASGISIGPGDSAKRKYPTCYDE